MDFNNFKPVRQANSVSSSIIVEGTTKKVKETQGYSLYPRVFQGCDKCGVIGHAIIGNKVVCLGCQNSYLLK